MKKLLLIAPLFMATALTTQAQGVNTDKPVYENYIQTTGKAEREVVPDQIYVQIVVNETELKNKSTLEQAENQMIEALKKEGVDTDKDLTIGNMSSAYRQKLFSRTGRTSAVYQLKVSSGNQLAAVYGRLEAMGISNMTIKRLSHSKITEFENEMRVEAVRNARDNARTLAEALGQKIGRAVFVNDYNTSYNDGGHEGVVVMAMARSSSDSAGAYGSSQLDLRNIKLNYQVTAKFVLE